METAINSKLNPRDIDRAETDLLINLSTLTQRKLAGLIGCHESKISRTDWRFIASILCAFRIAGEISPIGRVVKELMNGLQQEKAQNAGTFQA